MGRTVTSASKCRIKRLSSASCASHSVATASESSSRALPTPALARRRHAEREELNHPTDSPRVRIFGYRGTQPPAAATMQILSLPTTAMTLRSTDANTAHRAALRGISRRRSTSPKALADPTNPPWADTPPRGAIPPATAPETAGRIWAAVGTARIKAVAMANDGSFSAFQVGIMKPRDCAPSRRAVLACLAQRSSLIAPVWILADAVERDGQATKRITVGADGGDGIGHPRISRCSRNTNCVRNRLVAEGCAVNHSHDRTVRTIKHDAATPLYLDHTTSSQRAQAVCATSRVTSAQFEPARHESWVSASDRTQAKPRSVDRI
jgi:hypothetical protein